MPFSDPVSVLTIVTLQDAYDDGDGTITVANAGNKPVRIIEGASVPEGSVIFEIDFNQYDDIEFRKVNDAVAVGPTLSRFNDLFLRRNQIRGFNTAATTEDVYFANDSDVQLKPADSLSIEGGRMWIYGGKGGPTTNKFGGDVLIVGGDGNNTAVDRGGMVVLETGLLPVGSTSPGPWLGSSQSDISIGIYRARQITIGRTGSDLGTELYGGTTGLTLGTPSSGPHNYKQGSNTWASIDGNGLVVIQGFGASGGLNLNGSTTGLGTTVDAKNGTLTLSKGGSAYLTIGGSGATSIGPGVSATATRLDINTFGLAIYDAGETLIHNIGTATLGWFTAAASPVTRRTSGADLTNNVASGGTDDTIANYTDLTLYSNDSAAIRNNIYQLARKLKQINDGLRAYGLFT